MKRVHQAMQLKLGDMTVDQLVDRFATLALEVALTDALTLSPA